VNFLLSKHTSAIIQAIILVGLLLIDWANPADIVIIYALETMLIGAFHLFKMAEITFFRNNPYVSTGKGIFTMFFFLIHYGMFVSVQTFFFFLFISVNDERLIGERGFDIFVKSLQFTGVQAAGLVILVALTLRFFIHFKNSKIYDTVNIQQFMFVPYPRVFIQQFVAILPGFFMLFGKGAIVAAFVLIVLRLTWDIIVSSVEKNYSFRERLIRYLVKKQNKGKPIDPQMARNFIELVIED
jgi:hypothetical protein